LPYAAFSVLRDEFGTADYSKWTSYEIYSSSILDSIWKQDSLLRSKMMFYIFLQYQLELQIDEVKNIAKENGIVLKGDLPIGVGRFSVETWTHPSLFHLNQQAGAPPDAFTKKGQNWFFPTYNWEEMEKDNYNWWKARLKQLNRFFDAIRIDHILGFFRIWSIPLHAVEGLLGRFVPAHPLLKNDIESWGLETSLDKLFHPHISDNILKLHFSDRWETVKSVFFEDNQFKSSFKTQISIAEFIENNPSFSNDLPALFELLSDLIFLEDESIEDAYHFRINMMDTESYKGLSWNDQLILREHYYDYFYRKQDPDWKTGGSKKLDAIQHASKLLICAEDLGMVPDFVEGVLQAREMLALQVQRMPKKMGAAFSLTTDANYLSVVTPSTHDMSPIRAWWIEDEEQKQKFYKEIMHGIGEVPDSCSEEIVRWIVKDHLHSPSMWCVFLLQDILSCNQKFWRNDLELDRRNNPADPYHYWNFRSHVSIETLMDEAAFSSMLNGYFQEANRIIPSSIH
jgi:4-alpha-glucanotransferase